MPKTCHIFLIDFQLFSHNIHIATNKQHTPHVTIFHHFCRYAAFPLETKYTTNRTEITLKLNIKKKISPLYIIKLYVCIPKLAFFNRYCMIGTHENKFALQRMGWTFNTQLKSNSIYFFFFFLYCMYVCVRVSAGMFYVIIHITRCFSFRKQKKLKLFRIIFGLF